MSNTKLGKKSVSQDDGRHICSLDSDVANAFRRQTFYGALKTVTQISQRNPNTKYYFRSLAAVEKERKQHKEIKHGRIIIHPLSLFRLYWESIQMCIIYFGLLIVPINFVYGPVRRDGFHFGFYKWTETLEIISDVFYGVDFVMNFFTGYCNYNKKEIRLHFKSIARLYMSTTQFYLDVFCSLSIISVIKLYLEMVTTDHRIWLRYWKPVGVYKILRLVRFLDYYAKVSELLRHYYYIRISVRYVLLSIIAVHWLTCIYMMFMQQTSIYCTDTDLYIYTYEYEMLMMLDYEEMYFNCQYIVVSYLLCISLVTGYRTSFDSRIYTFSESAIFVVYSTFGFIFSNLLLILILQMIMSMNASEVKYHSIISQLIKYMEYKDLPRNMKERIICYYDYRFQKKYFRESTIMDMLSETLRREINLYSCRSLIETVSLLRDLPPDVISEVVFNLKHQVFLYNDIIVKASTTGDCMYFIANGTVAVSTPTGREICHLQDGAYFGEIALLSPDQKRIANVIAIEICEVYRLDRQHFRSCFETNSAFYKKIEQIAQERMEKTVLLEELHKKYLLDRTTKRKMGVKE